MAHHLSACSIYRFLSNDKIEESEILNGHFDQTKARIRACRGPVLVLHDTTELSFKRKRYPENIGFTRRAPLLNTLHSRLRKEYRVCGILMESVFQNLFLNALDAYENIDDGRKRTINVTSHYNTENVVVMFQDNGCGMAEQILARVFDSFFTTKAPAKEQVSDFRCLMVS